jgi:hypothetical protein
LKWVVGDDSHLSSASYLARRWMLDFHTTWGIGSSRLVKCPSLRHPFLARTSAFSIPSKSEWAGTHESRRLFFIPSVSSVWTASRSSEVLGLSLELSSAVMAAWLSQNIVMFYLCTLSCHFGDVAIIIEFFVKYLYHNSRSSDKLSLWAQYEGPLNGTVCAFEGRWRHYGSGMLTVQDVHVTSIWDWYEGPHIHTIDEVTVWRWRGFCGAVWLHVAMYFFTVLQIDPGLNVRMWSSSGWVKWLLWTRMDLTSRYRVWWMIHWR